MSRTPELDAVLVAMAETMKLIATRIDNLRTDLDKQESLYAAFSRLADLKFESANRRIVPVGEIRAMIKHHLDDHIRRIEDAAGRDAQRANYAALQDIRRLVETTAENLRREFHGIGNARIGQ